MYGVYSAQLLKEITGGDLANIFNLAKWFAFISILILFVVISVIVDHHWKSYGVRKQQIRLFRIIYYGVGATLTCVMAGSFFALIF